MTPEKPAVPTTDNVPTTEKLSLTNIQVVVTPEKPDAPTPDNVVDESPQAGEVHVLKMIVEDVDFDAVKVKKEPCSDDDNISSESDAKTNDKKRDEQPNIRDRDRQLNQNDNAKCDGEEKVSGRSVQPNITECDRQLNQNNNEKCDGQDKVSGRDGEKHNKPDEGKDKDDSIVTDADKQASEEKKVDVDENEVSGQRDVEEDPLIENDENKPDDEKDGQKPQEEVIENEENKPDDEKDPQKAQEDELIENEENKPEDEKDGKKAQEDEVIENEENKCDDEKDIEDSVLKDKVIEQHDAQDKEEEEEEKGDDEKDKEDSVLKGKVIEPRDRNDKEEEKKKHDVMEENDSVIELRDGHNKEEEKKHDVTEQNEGVMEKEAHVDSDGQQPQVEQISAWQFYKRTQTLSRAVRKQQQEHRVSGKQSPDECTVKIGRRSVCITDKVTENRSEIRQVYRCRLALQFKSRNNKMHPGISKPKEVSTNVDTSADISPSEMESTRTYKSDTEVLNKTTSKQEMDSSVDSVEYVDFFPSKLNHSVHNAFK